MRRSPEDPGFNRAVRDLVERMHTEEKLVFITTDDQIAEVIYPSQFGNGWPDKVRDALASRLKGVVHVAALHIGQKNTAPQISVVEYLPDGNKYHLRFAPSSMSWEPPEYQDADQSYDQLWRKEEP